MREHGFCLFLLAGVILIVAAGAGPPAQAAPMGIVGHPAPELTAQAWYNLPGGQTTFSLKAHRGKVVYMLFFQSWCPGCHSHGFPTLKKVHDRYGGEGEVVFVALQTTFEGFQTNDKEAARRTVEDFDLEIPTGHDSGPSDAGSTTMRRYRSGGTPWTVIVDRGGTVRFNGFRIAPADAIRMIETLVAEILESR